MAAPYGDGLMWCDFRLPLNPKSDRFPDDEKESEGRKIFYGAMIAEGVIALIWATAGMTFFGGTRGLQAALAAGGPDEISTTLLGAVGGILAILAVIILPITTGDIALRSSR